MRKTSNAKKCFSLLLSFVLAGGFFGVYLGLVLQLGFLGGNAWKSYLGNSGYGKEMAENAYEEICDVMVDAGIPLEAFQNLMLESELDLAYGKNVDAIQKGKNIESDSMEFQENLTEKIQTYLSEQQIFVTDSMEKKLEGAIAESGRIYERFTYPTWLVGFQTYCTKASSLLKILLIVCAVLCLVSAGLLFLLHAFKHRSLRYMQYGFCAATVWSALLCFSFGNTGWIKESGIAPASYVKLVEGYVNAGMKLGIILLLCQVVIIVANACMIKKMKHRM